MCNLYTVKDSIAEIAAHFGVTMAPNINVPEEILPGYPAPVMHEKGGERALRSMVWGFPFRPEGMKPESKPKAVNNIADLRKGMWVGLARKPEFRVIIPMTEFAEPEGEKGRKTRTWFSVKGQKTFGWGGLWRDSSEWGPVYSGAMADSNEAVRPVHDRMPVLLLPDEYDTWLRGSFDDLLALQNRSFPDDILVIRRTQEPWVKPRPKAEPTARLL
jgi:putative SOS response-associated peptidase YedK